jgi:hypothetical protein
LGFAGALADVPRRAARACFLRARGAARPGLGSGAAGARHGQSGVG